MRKKCLSVVFSVLREAFSYPGTREDAISWLTLLSAVSAGTFFQHLRAWLLDNIQLAALAWVVLLTVAFFVRIVLRCRRANSPIYDYVRYAAARADDGTFGPSDFLKRGRSEKSKTDVLRLPDYRDGRYWPFTIPSWLAAPKTTVEGVLGDVDFEQLDGQIELHGEPYTIYRLVTGGDGATNAGALCRKTLTLELPPLPKLKELWRE